VLAQAAASFSQLFGGTQPPAAGPELFGKTGLGGRTKPLPAMKSAASMPGISSNHSRCGAPLIAVFERARAKPRVSDDNNRSASFLERGRPDSVAVVDLDAADYGADSHSHLSPSRTMPSSLLRTLTSLRQRSQSQLAPRSRLVL
jgi:hypothetical protein